MLSNNPLTVYWSDVLFVCFYIVHIMMFQCSVPIRLDFDRPLWETLWFDSQLLAGWKCNFAQEQAGCHGAFHWGKVLSDPGAGGLVSTCASGEEAVLVQISLKGWFILLCARVYECYVFMHTCALGGQYYIEISCTSPDLYTKAFTISHCQFCYFWDVLKKGCISACNIASLQTSPYCLSDSQF